jgi:CMP-N,N'-diacetyllegionaminic acid synthase
MINNQKILALISARGGSKGVPRKNIRILAGKPLIAWTIEEAKKSEFIDRIILSSEDDEIISVAKKYGCEVPFKRPAEYAQDDTPGIEPVLHAVNEIGEVYDYVCLLQPTSPLRTVEDIDSCLRINVEKKTKCCVSVTESSKSPYWMYSINMNGFISPIFPNQEFITSRQKLPVTYELNGAIFMAEVNWLMKNKSFITSETSAFVMDKSNSFDIDSELDFSICEYLLNRRNDD